MRMFRPAFLAPLTALALLCAVSGSTEAHGAPVAARRVAAASGGSAASQPYGLIETWVVVYVAA
jgi:hypothetical protein